MDCRVALTETNLSGRSEKFSQEYTSLVNCRVGSHRLSPFVPIVAIPCVFVLTLIREGRILREIAAAINVIARARNGMGLMKKFPFVNVSRELDRHTVVDEF